MGKECKPGCVCPKHVCGRVVVEDKVNHPKHYTSHPSGVEAITVCEHMGFNLGNAMKYLWRCGLKDGQKDTDDLRKAIWYINREIQKRSKENGV